MLIRKAKTRGNKYRIELHQVGAKLFEITEFTSNRIVGKYCNIPTLRVANRRFDEIKENYAFCDNINLRDY